MEQVFSLSYIALYGLNQQTLQLGQHRTYLEIRKHEQKGQKKTAKIDFWFRKTFVLFLEFSPLNCQTFQLILTTLKMLNLS